MSGRKGKGNNSLAAQESSRERKRREKFGKGSKGNPSQPMLAMIRAWREGGSIK